MSSSSRTLASAVGRSILMIDSPLSLVHDGMTRIHIDLVPQFVSTDNHVKQ